MTRGVHCAMNTNMEFLNEGNHKLKLTLVKQQRPLFRKTPDLYPHRYEAPVRWEQEARSDGDVPIIHTVTVISKN